MIGADTKYVAFRSCRGDDEIVVFPKIIQHSYMADMVEKNSFGGLDRVSGGFIINGQCVGESESMRLESRGDVDTALLPKLLDIENVEDVGTINLDLSKLETRMVGHVEHTSVYKPYVVGNENKNKAKRLRKKRK